MEHIQTIELGSSQASIEFTSIPGDYDDLLFVMSTRTSRSSDADAIAVQFNGNTTGLSKVELTGTGSSVITGSGSFLYLGTSVGNNVTANTYANASGYVSNYTSSSAKSISTDGSGANNGTRADQTIAASLDSTTTSAITSARLFSINGATLLAGCTASLYGVTAGGSGTVTTA